MSEQVPPGYYRDPSGELKRDRRQDRDRRQVSSAYGDEDRRKKLRRQADLGLVEREHHQMIEEALAEFAAEHER